MAAPILRCRSQVRIPPGTKISVSCGCGVLSRTGRCFGPIPYSEESHRVRVVCDKGQQCTSTPTMSKKRSSLRKKERKKEKHQTRKVLIVTGTGRDRGQTGALHKPPRVNCLTLQL